MRRSLTILALSLMPFGAAAETLSYTWTPRTAQEAEAIRLGLALYGLRQEIRSGGSIRQWGRDNAAALLQSGEGNWGVIRQRGDGHRATLDQQGGGNAHAVLQAGEGAEATVTQTGREVGVTIQFGF
jgi:hypothetical protein